MGLGIAMRHCFSSCGGVFVVKIFGSGRCRGVASVLYPLTRDVCAIDLPGGREALPTRGLTRMIGGRYRGIGTRRAVRATIRSTDGRTVARNGSVTRGAIVLTYKSLSCLKRIRQVILGGQR